MKDSCVPINSLHPEILALIFSLVLDERSYAPTVTVFDPFRSDPCDLNESFKQARLTKIITISGVCAYWRRIALNNGAFWTYIPIFLTSRSIQRSLDSTSVWLDHAQTSPLHVFIDTRRSKKIHLLNLSETTLESALLEAPFGNKQIQTLYLSVGNSGYFNALLDNWFGTGVSGSLMKLRLLLKNEINDPLAFQNWLSQCQELRLFRMNAGPLCNDHFPLLPNLTDLELNSFAHPLTTLQFANVLRGCPNLRQLTLDDMSFLATASIDETPVPLQHLKVLNLTEINATSVLPLISSKSDSLSITITAMSLEDTSVNLIDYIGQLSGLSTITALSLNLGDIEPHDLRRLIYSLPHLQTFCLEDTYLDNPMVLALRGVDNFGGAGRSTAPMFPIPHAIWLIRSEIEDEETLRLLVGVRPLQQLKLGGCFLEGSSSILEEGELYEFLLDSVPDLIIY
ncbi:hypothetical protein BDV93DRAFT_361717 [Ceratobasidium sp. AG-I]|nr:hypothetical protein BDV93DRAFT_361717 [Ceratobasidium sp. AG-I]